MPIDWIQTYSGRKFHPLNPQRSEVFIEDIAHALSMMCRYTGHTKKFYSVAEHSVRVAWRVMDLGADRRTALAALLHDASEAYLCDIARPVKMQPEFAAYRAAEAQLQSVVYGAFGIDAEPALVKRADLELLSTEAHELMAPLHPEWIKTVDLPEPLPLDIALGWDPDTAEDLFLGLFVELAR
jgi:uncharacterized protein